MEPATLTAVVQAIVTIITTLSGVWAMFNKKTEKLSQENNELRQELTAMKSEMRQLNTYQSMKASQTYEKR